MKRPVAAAALAAAAFFSATPVPARADLLLPPPTARTPHRAVWLRTFHAVPDGLRPERDVRVREVSDAEMDRLVRDEANDADEHDVSEVDGMFLSGDESGDGVPVITLRRTMTAEESALVFAHELGHLVWESHLSRGERDRFEDAYRAARRDRRLVSAYAGESLGEGFAEAYSFYVVKPSVLKRRDPRSFAVLDALRAERGVEDAKPAGKNKDSGAAFGVAMGTP